MRQLSLFGKIGLAAFLAAVVGLTVFMLARPTPGGAHQMPAAVPAAHSDGLSSTESGYRFEAITMPASRGPSVPVEFRIVGPSGKAETGFLLNQTKLMHFFVVRDDMHVFQHVHPEVVGDHWRTAISIPDGGAYRMYAEFVPKDTTDPRHPVVLGVPFSIPGDTALVPVPEPSRETTTATGYTVTRVGGPEQLPVRQLVPVRLAVKGPDGTPVRRLEDHLGANGHMTGFNTMMLSATHMHPIEPVGIALVNGEITFQALFGERGEYRVFLEFRSGGTVHLAAFTIFVT